VPREDGLDAEEREVREVLVVMVSNWRPSKRRIRWGNSNVTVPVGFRMRGTPATNVFRSGTWASTLLPSTRSAIVPAVCIFLAVTSSKNATSDSTPTFLAAAATLAAGSTPRHGTPRLTKYWSR
jgi:hypothetical protein